MSELTASTIRSPASRRSASSRPSRSPASIASSPVPADTASGTISAPGAMAASRGNCTSMECSPSCAAGSTPNGRPSAAISPARARFTATSPPGIAQAPSSHTAIPRRRRLTWLVPRITTVKGPTRPSAAAAAASAPGSPASASGSVSGAAPSVRHAAAAVTPEYTRPACGTRIPAGIPAGTSGPDSGSCPAAANSAAASSPHRAGDDG